MSELPLPGGSEPSHAPSIRVLVFDDKESLRRGQESDWYDAVGSGAAAVRNILAGLQLHSRMEAVMYAVREKLLEVP